MKTRTALGLGAGIILLAISIGTNSGRTPSGTHGGVASVSSVTGAAADRTRPGRVRYAALLEEPFETRTQGDDTEFVPRRIEEMPQWPFDETCLVVNPYAEEMADQRRTDEVIGSLRRGHRQMQERVTQALHTERAEDMDRIVEAAMLTIDEESIATAVDALIALAEGGNAYALIQLATVVPYAPRSAQNSFGTFLGGLDLATFPESTRSEFLGLLRWTNDPSANPSFCTVYFSAPRIREFLMENGVAVE